jgi:hypothetical protein
MSVRDEPLDVGAGGTTQPAEPSRGLPKHGGDANLTAILDLLQNFWRQVGNPLLSLPDPEVIRRRLFSRALIRPFCITILYHNLLLFIDIFYI